jgi:hypothetical protein
MEHKQAIQNLVTETHIQIASYSFQPLQYTDPEVAVCLRWCLYIAFNQQIIMPILRRANLFRGRQLSQDELRHIIWQNFEHDENRNED